MIKVYQTVTGKNGNCFNACLASILEVDIDRLPKLNHGKGKWLEDYQNFLKPFNLGINFVEPRGSNYKFYGYTIGAFGVIGKDLTHAVVCKDGRKVHDPFPVNEKGRKLGKLRNWYVITVLDVTKAIQIL